MEGCHYAVFTASQDCSFRVVGTDHSGFLEELYCKMNGMSLPEMEEIVDTVCSFCREHEKAGFLKNVKVGIRIEQELNVP